MKNLFNYLLSGIFLVLFSLAGEAQPWTYNFGTATGTFNTASTPSTTFLSGLTALPSGGGTYRVRMGAGGGSFVVANPGVSLGTNGELQITAPTSASTNKFGVYSWTGTTNVAYVKVKIRTSSSDNGALSFSLGNSTFPSDNNNQAASYNTMLASFTINYTSGSISSIHRRNAGANTAITGSGISAGADQVLEVYGNNGATSTTYVIAGTTYTLNSQCWDLWVDGTKVSSAGGWAKAASLATGNLAGFCFYGESSTSNSATIYLDDLEYSNALPQGVTVNGTIGANEYGTHTNGQNQETNTITSYMTWDNTNLYIGIGATSNNSTEPAVFYFDVNPIEPVNGGNNANGSTTGFNNYDRCTVNLPFRGDFVVYFKDGYYEYRSADGSGGWSTQTTTGLTYAQSGAGAGQSQEISIPWSVMPGGTRPASFNWCSKKMWNASSSNNGVYGGLPAANPGGAQNVAAYTMRDEYYYTVSVTTVGSSTPPMSRTSFTQPLDITNNSFGAISVWDFTMNSSGYQIARLNTGGNWVISNNLVVGAGTLYFGSGGSGYGTTSVGNVNVLGGSLNMDQTNQPINVSGNVSIAGGTLALSGTSGGDLNVAGNWSFTSGTFTPNSRTVTFNGTAAAQTLTGSTTFDNLTINNTFGTPTLTLQASSAVTANTNVTFTAGRIVLGANNFTLGSSATVTTPTTAKYFVTNSTGLLIRPVSTGAVTFNVGNSSYNPITLTPSAGTNIPYQVRVIDAVTSPAPNNGTKLINRYWSVSAPTAPANTLTLQGQWNTGEANANYAAGTQVRVAYHNGTSWTQVNSTQVGANPFTSSGAFAVSSSDINAGITFGIGKDDGFVLPTFTWTGTTSSAWGTNTNWSPNGVPGAGDNVIISSVGSNMLDITSSQTVANFTLSGTGNFTISVFGSLTITGTITSTTSATPSLDCNSTVTISSASAQTIPAWNFGDLNASGGNRTLASSGTIGICGTFTPGAGAYTITGSTVDFNSTGSQTVNAMNYNNLTISQTRTLGTITLASGTIGVAGVFNPTAVPLAYSNTGNTIDYNSAGAQTIAAFGSYRNISNSGNGNRTLANGTIGLVGTYTPTSGTVTVGTSVFDFKGANGQVIPASSYYSITNSNNANRTLASSGVIDIAGTFTPGSGTFTITGSTIRYSNAAAGTYTIPVFATNVSERSYNNLEFAGGGSAIWECPSDSVGIAGNLTVTSGTCRIGGTQIGIMYVVGNLTIAGGTLDMTADAVRAGTMRLLGNYSMTSGSHTRSGAATGSFRMQKATGTQTLSQSGGTISGDFGWVLGQFVANKLQWLTNMDFGDCNVFGHSTLDFGTYVLSGSAGSQLTTYGTTRIMTAHADGIRSSGALGSVQLAVRQYHSDATYIYNGSVSQTINFSPTPGSYIDSLKIQNSVAAPGGVTFGTTFTINGGLEVGDGLLYLANYTISIAQPNENAITAGSGSFGPTQMIVTNGTGYLQRLVPSGASTSGMLWPIGDTTGTDEYSPVFLDFSTHSADEYIAYRVVDGVHPSNGTSVNYLSRYWVSSVATNANTYDYTPQYTYLAADVVGSTSVMNLSRYLGSWTEQTSNTSMAGNIMTTLADVDETTASFYGIPAWTGRVGSISYTWNGATDSNWGVTTNWTPNGIPGLLDMVTISSPGTNMLNITSARTVTDFTLSGTGDFDMSSSGTLTISGTVTSTSSVVPTLDCASTVFLTSASSQTIPAWNFGNLNATNGARVLASSGTIGICGTFTRGAGAYTVTGSTVDYNGTGAQTIAIGTYNNLTISQNRGGAAVTLGSGTITVAGAFSPTVTNNTVVVTGNTIDFSSSTSQTIPAFFYGTITNTGSGDRVLASSGVIDVNVMISMGAGTETITGSTVRYSRTDAGTFLLLPLTTSGNHFWNLELGGGASTNWRVVAGTTLTVGNNLSYTGAGTAWISNPIYDASSRTLAVNNNFTHTGSGTFRVGSGNIVTAYFTVADTATISSGNFEVVNTTSIGFSYATFGHLIINGTGRMNLEATSTTAVAEVVVLGNVVVTSTAANAIDLGSGTSNGGNRIEIHGNFSKSGTGTLGMSGTYASTARYYFVGSSVQQWSHTGTAITTANFQIESGASVQLQNSMVMGSTANANSVIVIGTLDCQGYTLSAGNAANTFTLQSTGTLRTASATGIGGTITGYTAANTTWTGSGTTSGGASFVFAGTNVNTGITAYTAQISTTNAYNFTWVGSGSLTLDRNIKLNGLDLTNAGLFYLGNNDLSLSSALTIGGSPFSATKMIVTDGTGLLIRGHTNGGVGIPFTWPIGDTLGVDEYSPVTVNNISVSLAGTLGFRVVDGVHPNMSPATVYASRYWPSKYTGGSSYNYTNATFTYLPADIVVGPETAFESNVWDPINSGWLDFSATSSAASNVLTLTSGPTNVNMPQGATQYDHAAMVPVPVYYQTVNTGNWNVASNWEISSDPNFVNPAPTTPSGAPNAINSRAIFIRNTHNMTVDNTVTVDSVVVRSGGKITVSNNSFTVANGTGTDLTVNSGGTIEFVSASNNSFVTQASSTTQVNGLMKQSSSASPDMNNLGTITIGATGTYEHARNAGIIPTCTWTAGSTCLLTGIGNNAPTGLAQSFHHFTVNSTITSSVNCSGNLQTILGKFKLTTNHPTFEFRLSTGTSFTLTVADSLIINNGFLSIASGGSGPCNIVANGPVLVTNNSTLAKTGAATANFTFNNNFQLDAGSTFEFNNAGSSNTTANFRGNVIMNGTILRTNGGTYTINFDKSSGLQTWTCNATFGPGLFNWNIGTGSSTNTVQLLSNVTLSTSAHTFDVRNSATFNMGPYTLIGTNTAFTLNATGAIKMGHSAGIVTAPTTDGNVQTSTRVFPGTASYFYNGAANQVTGNALPTTLTTTGNLNIEASSGIVVTLINNNTTTPTFNLISGLFAAGNTQQLNITSGGTVNATGGDWVTGVNAGLLNFPGTGTFTGNSNPYNVYISGGVNFGSGTVTIQNGGTLRINSGGFVNTNAPYYAAGSMLQYWVNNTYGRGLEWSAASGRGFPHHVNLGNNTLLNPADLGAADANVPFRTGGNVSVDQNSAIYMDFSGNNMIEDLVVGGSLILTGSLSGSATGGCDIYVAGDWINNGTSANFFPNNRGVFLNGTGAQNISGTNTSFPAFPYLLIDKTSGVVTLSRDIQVSNTLTLTAANVANINASTFTVYVSNTATGAVSRVGTGHVIGNLRRAFATGTNTYDFAVGDTAVYAPVSIAANGVSVSGSMTASTSTPDQSQIASSGLDATKSVNRYWTLSQTGLTLTGFDPTFNFVAGDVDGGVNTNNLLVGRYSAGWTYPTIGTRTSVSTQATGLSAYGDFALAECKTPAAFNVTGGGSYCSGGSGVPIGLSGSELFVSYQLQRNGVDIGSPVAGTGSAISFGNQVQDSTYTVVAFNLASFGCSSNMIGSVVVAINPTVTPSVSISSSPAGSVCAGTAVTYTAVGQFGGATPTYQWQVNGVNAGTNSASYNYASPNNGDVVRCIFTSSEVCPAPASDTSNVITMTVLAFQTPAVSIAASPSNTICAGDYVTFTATPTFGGGTPSYQWKLNGSNVGTNSPTYAGAVFVNGDQVECVMTSDYQCLLTPTANSNVVTMTVTAAPQVNAGSAMTTCGLTAYTFANGASNSNTTGIVWTENGAGSITSGSTTLTPTYTPAAGDLGNVVTFTLTGTGNAPCGTVIDQVTLAVTPLLNWYLDADGDGFGAPGIPVAACTNPGGRVTNNQDCCDANADVNPLTEWWADIDGDGYGSFVFDIGCFTGVGCSNVTWAGLIPYYAGAHSNIPYALDCNDNEVNVNPGMNEVCGNNTDDDCNGAVDLACNTPQNDAFTNATSVTVNNPNAYYPNCQIMNGSVTNAGISSQGNPANVSGGAGRDVWYRFVAPSAGVQIKVQPSGFDAVIELRTAAHPVGQVDVENANTTVGGLEILNTVSLTPNAVYYVGVRNYNATNTGTFTICISPLLQSGCGLPVPVGGFSTCANYKAIYRGAASYTFNFTGTGGTAPLATTVGTTAGLIPLSTPALDIRYGGVYSCRVDANYALVNGVGAAEPLTVLGNTSTANCSNIQIMTQPNIEVKASQRCPAAITRSAFLVGTAVSGNTIICGATGYRYRFTKVTDCTGLTTAGLPFTQDTPGNTPFLNLAAVFPSALPNIGYWKVEIAPIFSYGLGSYGPVQVIQITGTSASMMLPEINEGQDAEKLALSITEIGLYPNPNNGEMVNVNLTGLQDDRLDIIVYDAMGKLVQQNQFAVDGSINTILVFNEELVSGVYNIEFRCGEQFITRRMVVQN